ncbi:MAG: DeoR/GlpR family DNA-binding transcription regulator [Nocardioidaceae bacterium]
MYAEERQQAMAELVTRRGRVSVVELAQTFEVTTETVRRDLSTLEALNLIRRVHGGALPPESVTLLETRLSERDLAKTEEKNRIAECAALFVPKHESTLIIDAGSTTVRLAELLPREFRCTVFTHAVPVASRLADLPHVELHLLPGRVRRRTLAAVGVDTVQALSRIRADVAFVGTNGISASHGLSTPDHEEAATKAAIVAAAERVVVLCDSSKIGVDRTMQFAKLTDIDVLVTDADITDEQRAQIEAAHVEVVVA